MHKKAVMVIASASVILALVAGLVVFSQDSFLFGKQKIEVDNVQLYLESQTLTGNSISDSSRTFMSFTVRNLYSSCLTTVGLTINGVNSGALTFELPQGQTRDISLHVPNLILCSSTTYDVKLTFKFADGNHQDFSCTCTTPEFIGQ
jgi:hypothetical protein